MNSPNLLHGRIAPVAQRCVGVDLLPERHRRWELIEHVEAIDTPSAFASGIAELAEQHGLVPSEAATTDDSMGSRPKDRRRAVKRWLRRRQWRNVGFTMLGSGRRFLGETFVYVKRWR